VPTPPPAEAQVKEQTATNPVADSTPADAPFPDAVPTIPKEAAETPAPAQAPATTAAAPPTMLPRGPVPFLPPATSSSDAPSAQPQPRTEAAPEPAPAATSVASGTDEQSSPAESETPISIPGLVISD
jgi:DNA polymerase-3 subunit gamma/tau